jgi:Tfp pilus assembly protein PilF
MQTLPLASTLATLVFLPVFAGACTGKGANSPPGASAEKQSDAEYDLAREALHAGRPREALDHARKSVKFNEDNDKALYLAAMVHLVFCDQEAGVSSPDCSLDDAEKYLRRALKVNEGFRDAKNALGTVLIRQNKPREAIAVLEPLTKDPAFASGHLAWGNLGLAQLNAGDVDRAISSLKNAVTEPRFCVGHYRLGLAYEEKKDLPSAEKSFSDALAVPSADCQGLQDAWQRRATIRLKLGKTDGAREDLEKCVGLSSRTEAGKLCEKTLHDLGGKT